MQSQFVAFRVTVLLSLPGLCGLAVAQDPAITTLQIDVVNQRAYVQDIPDPLKFASDPTAIPNTQFRTFASVVNMGDIAAVNGKPAKGMFVAQGTRVAFSPIPAPGMTISDVARSQASQWHFEILQEDGTPIGTLMALGLSGGDPPPGAPADSVQHNMAIVGGTGAFLGARGQAGQAAQPFTNARPVNGAPVLSMVADPANRRAEGGGSLGFIVQFVPLSRPDIVTTSSGPAIFHADSSAVSEARPARAGEVLTVHVRGLGAAAQGTTPLEVLVGGKSVPIVKAVGGATLRDPYQVNFRVPDDAAAGTATIQLTAAWVASAELKIAVQ